MHVKCNYFKDVLKFMFQKYFLFLFNFFYRDMSEIITTMDKQMWAFKLPLHNHYNHGNRH